MTTFTNEFIATVVISVILGFLLLKVLAALVARLLPSGKGTGAPQKPLLLILGPCNSGKTLLFYKLQGQDNVNTVSSLRFNSVSLMDIPEDCPLNQNLEETKKNVATELLDFPGHPRLAHELEKLLPRAVGIVYMFDSTDKSMIKQGSEQLYDLLLHPDICRSEVPFLLVCNKSDLPGAKTQSGVTSDVLREIERLRISRSAALEGVDEAANFLGVEGKIFSFDDAPVPVSICAASLVNDDFQLITDFLVQRF